MIESVKVILEDNKNSHVYNFNYHFRDYIVSGSQDGILAVWSLDDGELLCQKQLFGRIEVVKAKNDILVTAHFGLDYDVGCISVRQIVTPVDLPVIFSIYEVSLSSTFSVDKP